MYSVALGTSFQATLLISHELANDGAEAYIRLSTSNAATDWKYKQYSYLS